MSTIETMIDKIMEKDYAGAGDDFGSIIANKVNDALETEKVVVAAEIYNGFDRSELDEDLDEAAEKHGLEITQDDLDEGDYKGDENKKSKQKKFVKGTDVAYEV